VWLGAESGSPVGPLWNTSSGASDGRLGFGLETGRLVQLLQGLNQPLEPLIRRALLGDLQGIYAQINRGFGALAVLW
jgi:hypothetical protein